MTFEGFRTVDFSPLNELAPGFVYVIFWVRGKENRPFYVGQSKRIWGRLDDYYWAQFAACTDYRVGEAIKYLTAKDFRIVVRYRSSADPVKEERSIIDQLQSEDKLRLLNDFRGYDYRTAKEPDEKVALHRFIDGLIGI